MRLAIYTLSIKKKILENFSLGYLLFPINVLNYHFHQKCIVLPNKLMVAMCADFRKVTYIKFFFKNANNLLSNRARKSISLMIIIIITHLAIKKEFVSRRIVENSRTISCYYYNRAGWKWNVGEYQTLNSKWMDVFIYILLSQ